MSRLALLPLSTTLVLVGMGLAQAQTAKEPKDPKAKPAPSASVAVAPASASAVGSGPTGPSANDTPVPLPQIPLGSGPPLTADEAAKRAVKTSKQAKVDEAKIKAAGAAVDQAFVNYFPRLTFQASYTRLSPIDPPTLGSDQAYSVAVVKTPGVVPGSPLPAGSVLVASPNFAFPVLLNQYSLSATLVVPLSDYVFRIYDNHKSTLASEEAAKWTAKVNENATATDARVAFYNVLRARGTVVIAKAAVAQAESHLKDLKVRLELKAATTADVAQVEASRAGAELAVIKAENLVIITEANLRMLMHSPEEETFSLGEDLMVELPKFNGDLKQLKADAAAKRPEIKAIDAQIASIESSTKVVSAGLYPRLDGVAQLLTANPNQRIFPSQDKFNTTWSLGLQLTWSPNDALVANEQKKSISASSVQLKATREQLVDGLALDVTNAWVKVREADASVVSTGAELRAAEEALRVRKEQFLLGGITSTILTDAEADVTRARLNHLNARVEARIARAQLKKAVGEP